MKNFGWMTGSWATALLLGLPVIALLFSAFSAEGGAVSPPRRYRAARLSGQYSGAGGRRSIAQLAVWRAYRLAGGHVSGTGAARPAVGLDAADGHALLYRRLRLYRPARLLGPATGRVASTLWLEQSSRLLVSCHSLPWRRRLGAGAGAVPLCLSADPRLFSRAVSQPDPLQPPARLYAVAELSSSQSAAGAPCHHGGGIPGCDGNAGRFRHRPLLCHQHPDHGGLRHLARLRQSGHCGQTLLPDAAGGGAADRAGASLAQSAAGIPEVHGP